MADHPPRRERDYVVIASRAGLTEAGLALGVLAATRSADGTTREEILSLRLSVETAEEMQRLLASALEAARMGPGPLTRQ